MGEFAEVGKHLTKAWARYRSAQEAIDAVISQLDQGKALIHTVYQDNSVHEARKLWAKAQALQIESNALLTHVIDMETDLIHARIKFSGPT